MNLCQLIKLASKNVVLQQCICLHLVLHHIIHPPHNCKVSATPMCHCRKNLKALGGQSYPEWAEIEKKLKVNFAARCQKQKEKELAQRKEALPIDITDEKN